LIAALKDLGIEGKRTSDTGVWVRDKKIAALGHLDVDPFILKFKVSLPLTLLLPTASR
jgi:hypothetical protein